MLKIPTITYYGWSALSIDTDEGSLFFDPFFRKYCNAKWFDQQDFAQAKYICVTHGHEEHFLDVPVLAKQYGATVLGPDSLVKFLAKRNKIPDSQLISINSGETHTVPGFTVSAFDWKHRDINLAKALTKAIFRGNTTQLAWAWSSATSAPFYAPYTGYHVELPNGMTVLNYNEGFNSKMTDGEIAALGKRFRTDVLLAGMQLDFVEDVVRGAKALAPKIVVLYPPHEAFHAMMGVTSRPWSEFHAAVAKALPQATVVLANPGDRIDMASGRSVGNLLAMPRAA
jgi:L-ascorbate metabolism protein UlaG (beta-lactamase superfamily)